MCYFIVQYVYLQKDVMFILWGNTVCMTYYFGDLKKEADKLNAVVSCKQYKPAIENRPNSVVAASA